MTTKLSGDIIRFFTKSVPKSTTEPELGAEQDYEPEPEPQPEPEPEPEPELGEAIQTPVPETWKYVKSISSTENVVFTNLDDIVYKLTFTYNKTLKNVLVFDENVAITYWYIVCGGGGGGGGVGGVGGVGDGYDVGNTGGGGGGGDTMTNLDTYGNANIPFSELNITVGNGGNGYHGEGGGNSGNKGTKSTLVVDNNTITALGGIGGNGGRNYSVGKGGISVGNGGSGANGSIFLTYPPKFFGYASKNADNGFLINSIMNLPDNDSKYYYGWGGPGGDFYGDYYMPSEGGEPSAKQSYYGAYGTNSNISPIDPITTDANPQRLYGGGGGKGQNINSSGNPGEVGNGVPGVIIIYYQRKIPSSIIVKPTKPGDLSY